MPSGKGAGTKPIHNKTAKSKKFEDDDDPSAAEHRRKMAEDAKARKALAAQASNRGPLNTGQQGIKKSGKK